MATNNTFIHSDRCGITVVGSGRVRVIPDSATIIAAIARSEPTPTEAFAAAKAAAAGVHDYLKGQGVRNFSSSRITLTRDFLGAHVDPAKPTLGYKARISLSIKVPDLDRVEDLVAGVVSAGANELQAVTYQSSLMEDMRNDARRQAIASAREKAELYCHEAGVSLGRVLAIEEPPLLPVAMKPPGAAPAAASGAEAAEINVAVDVTVIFAIARDGLE